MKGLEELIPEMDSTTEKENEFAEVFLKHVMDNMSSSMYLLDKDRRIVSMNRAAHHWIQKESSGLLGSLFGNAITCTAAADPHPCGTTVNCQACKLKQAIEQAFEYPEQLHNVYHDTKFIVEQGNTQKRYLRYNVQALSHKGKAYALLMLDDITRIEKQKLREEEKNKQLISGLKYARHLQKTMLPTAKRLDDTLPGMALFYQPKNIIGGDFYWIHQTPEATFVVLADYTGHGIPGAMLSILGISSLNLIVKERGITKPAEILNQLRQSFVESMQQKDIHNSNDGMDISICRIDKAKQQLTFAGANNGIIIITPQQETRLFNGNKMPVGKYADMAPFSEQNINISQNDRIFLFTDGYKDQFGGPRNKKFKRQPFIDLLQKAAKLPQTELADWLAEEFRNWKGKNEQTDDVTVLSFRLS